MLFKTEDDGTLIMIKSVRVGMRLFTGIVLMLMPITTTEQLDPVELLSVVMTLFAFVVIWETVGGLQKRARVYEKWEGRNRPDTEDDIVQDAIQAGEK